MYASCRPALPRVSKERALRMHMKTLTNYYRVFSRGKISCNSWEQQHIQGPALEICYLPQASLDLALDTNLPLTTHIHWRHPAALQLGDYSSPDITKGWLLSPSPAILRWRNLLFQLLELNSKHCNTPLKQHHESQNRSRNIHLLFSRVIATSL